MAKLPSVPHTLKVGSRNYTILLPDVYNGLGTQTGITKGAPDESDGTLTVGDALKTGKAGRVRISWKENGKSKSTQLVVAIDKMDTAIGDLVDKSYRSNKITSAGIKRRRILR